MRIENINKLKQSVDLLEMLSFILNGETKAGKLPNKGLALTIEQIRENLVETISKEEGSNVEQIEKVVLERVREIPQTERALPPQREEGTREAITEVTSKQVDRVQSFVPADTEQFVKELSSTLAQRIQMAPPPNRTNIGSKIGKTREIITQEENKNA